MRVRSAPCLVVLAVLAVFCLGMGGFGGADVVSKIPKPDRAFSVHLVDAENMTYDVDQFSVEGLTYVPATLGKAEVGVDFANLARAMIFREGEDMVRADLTFKDGTAQQVRMSPKVQFYGKTAWGLMRLAAKDVREIDFK